jgi:MFS family permease
VPFGSITTAQLFIVGAVAFSVSMLPISLSTAQAPQPLTSVIVDPVALFKRSPAAMAGSFLAGVIFSNWSYFGPIYGKAMNFSTTSIATMLTLTMIGGMLFQFPFGRLSDKIDRRYVMALVGGAGTVISATMVLNTPGDSLYIFLGMFSLGSVMFPMYALNVAHANDFAKPEEFVQVSGGLLIVYGIGSMAGPQFGGRLIDAAGPSGFFVAMGLAYAVYGLYALWRSSRKDAIAPAMRPDFKIVPMSPTQTPQTAVIYAPIQDAK